MKKLLGVFALLSVLVLAACSNVSEKYAQKIMDETLSYVEVCEDLGDEAISMGIGESKYTGVVIAVKGCESLEEIEAKLEAGKDVKGIRVYFLLGQPVYAKYQVITAEDLNNSK